MENVEGDGIFGAFQYLEYLWFVKPRKSLIMSYKNIQIPWLLVNLYKCIEISN